jgi:hypothetical protein
MLESLQGRVSDRKLRLFAVASARLASAWLVHPDSRAAVEISERVAEGIYGPDALAPAYRAAWAVLPLEPYSDVHVAAARAAARTVQDQAYEAALLTRNEVVGFYAEAEEAKVTSEEEKERLYWIGKDHGERLLTSCLRDIFGNPFCNVSLHEDWLTPTVVALARAIYDDQDFDALPVLADALEDADCSDPDVLSHLRGPGPHVRGCHVVDLLTGRS